MPPVVFPGWLGLIGLWVSKLTRLSKSASTIQHVVLAGLCPVSERESSLIQHLCFLVPAIIPISSFLGPVDCLIRGVFDSFGLFRPFLILICSVF